MMLLAKLQREHGIRRLSSEPATVRLLSHVFHIPVDEVIAALDAGLRPD